MFSFSRDGMEALSHICQFNFPKTIRWGQNFTNSSIYDTLEDIAPSLNYSMFKCSWLNQNAPCSTYFTPVLSENGLCFSFNTLNSNEMFSDEYVIKLASLSLFNTQKRVDFHHFHSLEWRPK